MRPLGIGIATWLILGVLIAVDYRYNNSQAMHGLGQLARSLLPQVNNQ